MRRHEPEVAAVLNRQLIEGNLGNIPSSLVAGQVVQVIGYGVQWIWNVHETKTYAIEEIRSYLMRGECRVQAD